MNWDQLSKAEGFHLQKQESAVFTSNNLQDLVNIQLVGHFLEYNDYNFIMDNFFIEGKNDDTYSLRKLLKYYAYLFVTSIFVSFLGSIIYIVLLIELYTTCNA